MRRKLFQDKKMYIYWKAMQIPEHIAEIEWIQLMFF